MTTEDTQALLTILDDTQITQRELAQMVGVSRVTVNRWAAGLATPSPAIERILKDVCFVLECALEADLLPGNLPPAHSKTVEDRWEMIQNIFKKAHGLAKKKG